MQLIQVISLIWKQKVNGSQKDVEINYVVQDHHHQLEWLYCTNSLREKYIQCYIRQYTIFPKIFWQSFSKRKFRWEKNYNYQEKKFPRVVTINRFQLNFEYTIILHNILYLNKSPWCSFCHSCDETIKHIFLECIYVKKLWNHLRFFLMNISLPMLTPQTEFY